MKDLNSEQNNGNQNNMLQEEENRVSRVRRTNIKQKIEKINSNDNLDGIKLLSTFQRKHLSISMSNEK